MIREFWWMKRWSRHGIALLRRLQATNLADHAAELAEDRAKSQLIRQTLEKTRMIVGQIVRREKLKKRLIEIQQEVFDMESNPLRQFLQYALTLLRKRDRQGIFEEPVVTEFPEKAKDYLKVVKTPMDFETIESNIYNDQYWDFQSFVNDFQLVCQNAMDFNPPGHEYHDYALKIFVSGNAALEGIAYCVASTLAEEPCSVEHARAQSSVGPPQLNVGSGLDVVYGLDIAHLPTETKVPDDAAPKETQTADKKSATAIPAIIEVQEPNTTETTPGSASVSDRDGTTAAATDHGGASPAADDVNAQPPADGEKSGSTAGAGGSTGTSSKDTTPAKDERSNHRAASPGTSDASKNDGVAKAADAPSGSGVDTTPKAAAPSAVATAGSATTHITESKAEAEAPSGHGSSESPAIMPRSPSALKNEGAGDEPDAASGATGMDTAAATSRECSDAAVAVPASANSEVEEGVLQEMLLAREISNPVTRANAFIRWGKDLVYYRTNQLELMSERARDRCGIHVPAKPKKALRAAAEDNVLANILKPDKTGFASNDFVWAQSTGCPFWPAQIIDPLNLLTDNDLDAKDHVEIPKSLHKSVPDRVQDILDDAEAGITRKKSTRNGASEQDEASPYMFLIRYFSDKKLTYTWDWVTEEGLAHMFEEEFDGIKKSKIDHEKLSASARKKSAKTRLEVRENRPPSWPLCASCASTAFVHQMYTLGLRHVIFVPLMRDARRKSYC